MSNTQQLLHLSEKEREHAEATMAEATAVPLPEDDDSEAWTKDELLAPGGAQAQQVSLLLSPQESSSYLSLVATNPRRGSVWGGETITELQACQRRLAVANALTADTQFCSLDYDVLVRMCCELRGIICFDDGSSLAQQQPLHKPVVSFFEDDERDRRRRLRGARMGRTSGDTLTNRSKLIKLDSRWSRWATFGHKGSWQGEHEEPPSSENFARVMAAVTGRPDAAEKMNKQLGGAKVLTEDHARAFARSLSSATHGLALSATRGHGRHTDRAKPQHVRCFLSVDSAEQKACIKHMLHDGFHESVHGNIDDAVDGVAEFSPEIVMEHLECGQESGTFTTATTHSLGLKLNNGAVDEILVAEHREQARRNERARKDRGLSDASDSITLHEIEHGSSAAVNRCSGSFCSAVCNRTQISASDLPSLCCEALVEASAWSEIYLGVAPSTVLIDGLPEDLPLDGTLFDRCPGWLALRLADGGLWCGTDGSPRQDNQLLGDLNWKLEAADGSGTVTSAAANASSATADNDGTGDDGGDCMLLEAPMDMDGADFDFLPDGATAALDAALAPFAQAGDRVRLEIVPDAHVLVISTNGHEQGRLPLPPLTLAALESGDLRWVVTMAHQDDAVSISFPKGTLSPPEQPEEAASRPLDAGISYRRLVRKHISEHAVVESELIYEVLFMASAPELKRLGIGTLLVDQLKHMLDGEAGAIDDQESLEPAITKRSLCVSIKSESREALAFWASMGLMPAAEDDPSERQLVDLMVPFADFTPVAATWAAPKGRGRPGQAQPVGVPLPHRFVHE